MLSKDFCNQILDYYENYKEEYNKNNIIGIIPCECVDDTKQAYTDNEELMECIKNELNVALYVNSQLMSCSNQYIKAVLFHEFTHICDAYNFVGYDNSSFLMSTYSEYNAMRIEIKEKCKNKPITLNTIICGENGNISLNEEIEDKIETILMILKMTGEKGKEILEQGKEGMFFDLLIKTISYLFAYLSFFKITEPVYFQNCFMILENNGLNNLAKKIYNEVQSLDRILDTPNSIILDIVELYHICFGKI